MVLDLIGRKDIQHHGVGYTSSATRFGLALSHDIRSCDLQPPVNIIPTLTKKNYKVATTKPLNHITQKRYLGSNHCLRQNMLNAYIWLELRRSRDMHIFVHITRILNFNSYKHIMKI